MRYLVAIAALAMLCGCGVKESFSQAAVEVDQFHRALDAEQYAAIWKTTGSDMRAATTQDQLTKVLAAVHRKLGRVKDSKQVGWNTNATTGGTFLTLAMQTTFEKGAGTEQFVYRKIDEKNLQLAGYNIQSQDMMIN